MPNNCKTTVGAHFYLTDNDGDDDDDDDGGGTNSISGDVFIKDGMCKYAGHTNKVRPQYDVVGLDVNVVAAPWPDSWSCEKLSGVGEILCPNDFFPRNACVVDLC
jgi:hypothetical protein